MGAGGGLGVTAGTGRGVDPVVSAGVGWGADVAVAESKATAEASGLDVEAATEASWLVIVTGVVQPARTRSISNRLHLAHVSRNRLLNV